MIVIMTLFFFQIQGPPSLKTYLGFVASFLDFLAGSEDLRRRLELTANDIQISKVGIKEVRVAEGGRAARNCGAVSKVFIYSDLIFQWKFTLTKTEYASLSTYMNC